MLGFCCARICVFVEVGSLVAQAILTLSELSMSLGPVLCVGSVGATIMCWHSQFVQW